MRAFLNVLLLRPRSLALLVLGLSDCNDEQETQRIKGRQPLRSLRTLGYEEETLLLKEALGWRREATEKSGRGLSKQESLPTSLVELLSSQKHPHREAPGAEQEASQHQSHHRPPLVERISGRTSSSSSSCPHLIHQLLPPPPQRSPSPFNLSQTPASLPPPCHTFCPASLPSPALPAPPLVIVPHRVTCPFPVEALRSESQIPSLGDDGVSEVRGLKELRPIGEVMGKRSGQGGGKERAGKHQHLAVEFEAFSLDSPLTLCSRKKPESWERSEGEEQEGIQTKFPAPFFPSLHFLTHSFLSSCLHHDTSHLTKPLDHVVRHLSRCYDFAHQRPPPPQARTPSSLSSPFLLLQCSGLQQHRLRPRQDDVDWGNEALTVSLAAQVGHEFPSLPISEQPGMPCPVACRTCQFLHEHQHRGGEEMGRRRQNAISHSRFTMLSLQNGRYTDNTGRIQSFTCAGGDFLLYPLPIPTRCMYSVYPLCLLSRQQPRKQATRHALRLITFVGVSRCPLSVRSCERTG
eukprot:757358-Hanusia_phi.AAC.5